MYNVSRMFNSEAIAMRIQITRNGTEDLNSHTETHLQS